MLLGTVAVALLVGAALAYFLSGSIARGVSEVGRAARGLAEGDLDQTIDVRSKDELGTMAASFREMIAYQQEMAGLAGAIARGDLTQSVDPKSPRDQLGTAFHEMIRSLRELVGQVATSAHALADTSAQLSSAAAQTGSAVQQVTIAVQNVASGAQETSRSAQETTAGVTQLSQVIDGIARGATDQARQVQTTSASLGEHRADERTGRGDERASAGACDNR
jgi:methyl-accepting chemotaxis protein